MSDEPEDEQEPGGIAASAQRIGQSLLGLLHARVELFAVELQEEKLRTLRTLVWFALALTLFITGVFVAVGTLALFLWRTTGYVGLVGLAVVLLGVAGAGFVLIRRHLMRGPTPFTATVAEFKKDIECLQHRE